METVKRKINALKDEIERKDEGQPTFTRKYPNRAKILKNVQNLNPRISRYHSPPRKVKERTNGKGKI